MSADQPLAGIIGPQGFNHCPACGSAMKAKVRGGRQRPTCPDCGRSQFHNPAVGVAVIIRDELQRLLLVRRAATATRPQQWCIPCGYVEWDEDVRQAAIRELEEETGLVVQLGDVFTVHSNWHEPNQHTVGIWFHGHVVGGELNAGDDADEAVFAQLDQLPGPLAFPTDEMVIAELVRLSYLA